MLKNQETTEPEVTTERPPIFLLVCHSPKPLGDSVRKFYYYRMF